MRWKLINDFPIYIISENGIVKNVFTGTERKMVKNPKGYWKVLLCYKQVKKNIFIHRLVANHFISNAPIGKEVNHKDSNKDNNHFSNLEWTTHQENMTHYKMTRKIPRG